MRDTFPLTRPTPLMHGMAVVAFDQGEPHCSETAAHPTKDFVYRTATTYCTR